ncbi:MAG: hypothetical protein IJD92_03805 [Bacilli bacterium]|nr:hypothetical protein [Bacilli bacterium]
MIITKSKNYNKSYNKYIIKKHLILEKERINNIENIIISSKNLQDLLNNPYKNIYHIEQKQGNLKEYYTARINNKMRLIMKPVGDYPYNILEIETIEFQDIDNKHYGEG